MPFFPVVSAVTRMRYRARMGCLALLMSLPGMAATAADARHAAQVQAFDLRVPWTPQPVRVDGRAFLVYELYLTNYAQQPLALRDLAVLDQDDHVLAEWNQAALNEVLGRPDQPSQHDRTPLPPGATAIAYLSVRIDGLASAWPRIKHRVLYATDAGRTLSVEGGFVQVDKRKPLQLGPPLRGGPWVAIYDPRWERGHRRVLYAINGSVHIPGRFAIDWIRVGEHGGYANGDGATPSQWLGYGAPVLAVADATVAAVGDGMAEARSLAEATAHKVPIENAAGNYVALALGDGRYAFYEHLKPGSITVKPGDCVRRGQVIGRLGFTGESTGPHLHFHISDANAPLDAEGLPYALERFRVLGNYPSIDVFDQGKPWQPSSKPGGDVRAAEFPAPLAVVDFGENAGPDRRDRSSAAGSAQCAIQVRRTSLRN